ncbi:RagB/SusD family nutrient uptake outer membrane protein [Mucilaginibacter corticis]|nr:RagB/SusD family nutrient uptake outer membrane protein [Mucilaginibacter corticis]
MKKKLSYILSGILIIAFYSCKKLVEVDPPITRTTEGSVFSTDDNAIAVVTNIYESLSQQDLSGNGSLMSLSAIGGLYADELNLFDATNTGLNLFYTNSLNPTVTGPWGNYYATIFTTNTVLSGLGHSATLSPAVKTQLKGEAEFIRAFCYFYLVNLYGDVPLVVTPDYKVNSVLSRSPVASIYQQITNDLLNAEADLSSDYLDGTLKPYGGSPERVRPAKAAATALLSRVYLYQQKYAEAEIYASKLIADSTYALVPLDNVFLKNSKEAIWQIQPTLVTATQEGRFFVLPPGGPGMGQPVYLSDTQLNVFDVGDGRRTKWIDIASGFYFDAKYKVGGIVVQAPVTTEYSMVLRLAEQYLIRAEARIKQHKIDAGVGDLNILRGRARVAPTSQNPNPLPPLPIGMSAANAMKAVERERQCELFCEWGNRFFDLKRWPSATNPSISLADEELSQVKKNWKSTDKFWPILQDDIVKDPALKQNPGY